MSSPIQTLQVAQTSSEAEKADKVVGWQVNDDDDFESPKKTRKTPVQRSDAREPSESPAKPPSLGKKRLKRAETLPKGVKKQSKRLKQAETPPTKRLQPQETPIMSESPIKSASSVKSASLPKSASSVKSETPVKSASSLKSASSVKSETPVKSASSLKSETPVKATFIDLDTPAPQKQVSPIKSVNPAKAHKTRKPLLTGKAKEDRKPLPLPKIQAPRTFCTDIEATLSATADMESDGESKPFAISLSSFTSMAARVAKPLSTDMGRRGRGSKAVELPKGEIAGGKAPRLGLKLGNKGKGLHSYLRD